MRLSRYRVLRPLLIHGRLAGTGEVVRLPEHVAVEWIESGHLREIDPALLVAGSTWGAPITRST